MLGTAVPSGHSHTAGAAAGMVWQQLGVLQTFVAEVNSSLVNTDMGNVVTARTVKVVETRSFMDALSVFWVFLIRLLPT